MGGCHERKLPRQDQHKSQRHLGGVCRPFVSAPWGTPGVRVPAERGRLIRASSVRRLHESNSTKKILPGRSKVANAYMHVSLSGRVKATTLPSRWASRALGKKGVFGACRAGPGNQVTRARSLCHSHRGRFWEDHTGHRQWAAPCGATHGPLP